MDLCRRRCVLNRIRNIFSAKRHIFDHVLQIRYIERTFFVKRPAAGKTKTRGNGLLEELFDSRCFLGPEPLLVLGL